MKINTQFSRGLPPDDAAHKLPSTDLLAAIMQETAPCQKNAKYLVAKDIAGTACRTYTGLKTLEGIQCHGAIVIPIRDANQIVINALFIVHLKDGTFKSLLVRQTELAGNIVRIGKEITGTILITPDWASGVSLNLATGHPVAVTMTAENLERACKMLAANYPDQKLIVCADKVGEDDHNFILANATRAAIASGASLAIPEFDNNKSQDAVTFNDLHRAFGLDAVRTRVEAATESSQLQNDGSANLDEEVQRLAQLNEDQYEQQRSKVTKKLGIRAVYLDKRVAKERQKQEATEAQVQIAEKSWPEEVNGSELLSDLVKVVKRFTVLPEHAAIAVALWIAMTYTMAAIQVAPILGILSPVKRCGKTTVLSLLMRLVLRALSTSNVTAAALFRFIEAYQPTLGMDEADTYMHKSDERNGIINSGHTRSTAFVMRVENGQPKLFSTWCDKAVAMIGEPPETILDRCVPIRLRRKRTDELVDPIRHASDEEFKELRARLARWAADNIENIKNARPPRPALANDRAADNWEPLLAIALCADQEWYEMAVEAAIALSADHDESRSLGEELLHDIHDILQTTPNGKITTVKLIQALCTDDDKPWLDYARGRPITSRQLAVLLAKFRIKSKDLRVGGSILKGYDRADFADAFARYVDNAKKD